MNIQMNEQTANHIINELQAVEGTNIRFFARYGGSSLVHQGFSLGVTKDVPKHPITTLFLLDHVFYIEHDDAWFFDHYNLSVSIKDEEIHYEFLKN